MKNKVGIVSADSYDMKDVNEALDNLFSILGMDKENPFKEIITPGMIVFIKPNWVASKWRESCNNEGDIYSVITHPSFIEAVADRVAIALEDKGKIIIGDNPSIDADFEELMSLSNIRKLESKYEVECEVIDMRPLVCKDLKDYGKKEKMSPQQGDPSGNITVDIGSKSLLHNVDSDLFRGVFEERDETIAAHSMGTHLYTYGKSLYDADVYISIPKLKTHQKAGVTLNLKGLVGSITEKNQLVHWRIGYPEIGGDEYPDYESWLASKTAKVTHRGSWPGNDTIWRMVVDIYTGIRMKKRKYFSIIDGIVAGEGKGPFCPSVKNAKVILGGKSLVATDIVASKAMGLNPTKIKYLEHFLNTGEISYNSIDVLSEMFPSNMLHEENSYLDFKVDNHWKIIKTMGKKDE